MIGEHGVLARIGSDADLVPQRFRTDAMGEFVGGIHVAVIDRDRLGYVVDRPVRQERGAAALPYSRVQCGGRRAGHISDIDDRALNRSRRDRGDRAVHRCAQLAAQQRTDDIVRAFAGIDQAGLGLGVSGLAHAIRDHHVPIAQQHVFLGRIVDGDDAQCSRRNHLAARRVDPAAGADADSALQRRVHAGIVLQRFLDRHCQRQRIEHPLDDIGENPREMWRNHLPRGNLLRLPLPPDIYTDAGLAGHAPVLDLVTHAAPRNSGPPHDHVLDGQLRSQRFQNSAHLQLLFFVAPGFPLFPIERFEAPLYDFDWNTTNLAR